jgi:hypothetical protein
MATGRKRRARSPILASVHDAVAGLHDAGVIDKVALRRVRRQIDAGLDSLRAGKSVDGDRHFERVDTELVELEGTTILP